jgi:uncharacterized membrane protein (UPF0182 family)
MKLAGKGLRMEPLYARLSTLGLLVIGMILGMSTIDGWTLVRYVGAQASARTAADAWRDPVFGNTLPFYFFDLPFYSELLGYVVALAFVSAAVYWLTARGWMIQQQAREIGSAVEINIQNLRLRGGPEPLLLRVVVAIFLLGMAGKAFLDRYDFLNRDHGFMVGADYVNTNIGVPLQWMSVAAFVYHAPHCCDAIRVWLEHAAQRGAASRRGGSVHRSRTQSTAAR